MSEENNEKLIFNKIIAKNIIKSHFGVKVGFVYRTREGRSNKKRKIKLCISNLTIEELQEINNKINELDYTIIVKTKKLVNDKKSYDPELIINNLSENDQPKVEKLLRNVFELGDVKIKYSPDFNKIAEQN